MSDKHAWAILSVSARKYSASRRSPGVGSFFAGAADAPRASANGDKHARDKHKNHCAFMGTGAIMCLVAQPRKSFHGRAIPATWPRAQTGTMQSKNLYHG